MEVEVGGMTLHSTSLDVRALSTNVVEMQWEGLKA